MKNKKFKRVKRQVAKYISDNFPLFIHWIREFEDKEDYEKETDSFDEFVYGKLNQYKTLKLLWPLRLATGEFSSENILLNISLLKDHSPNWEFASNGEDEEQEKKRKIKLRARWKFSKMRTDNALSIYEYSESLKELSQVLKGLESIVMYS